LHERQRRAPSGGKRCVINLRQRLQQASGVAREVRQHPMNGVERQIQTKAMAAVAQ